MPSPFDAYDLQLSDLMLRSFGETEAAVIRPRAESQYVERPTDGTRPGLTLRGIFSAGPADGQVRGNATGDYAGTTRFAQTAPEFWVPAAEVAALPYKIAQGDLLRFPGRPGSPGYAIVSIQHTDLGDLNLILVAENLS